MSLTTDEAALAGYRWAQANEFEKALLFTSHPEYRKIFARLPGDNFSLLAELDSSIWPDLLKVDYSILDRGVEDTAVLLQALTVLDEYECLVAFQSIRRLCTRQMIYGRLCVDSKRKVKASLTQASIERMARFKHDPSDDAVFTATDEFLLTLHASARTCHSPSCVKDVGTSFKELSNFVIDRCLRHSFHIECIEHHTCTRVEKHEKLRVPNEILLDIVGRTSPFMTGLVSQIYQLSPLGDKRFNNVWFQIFKNDAWLNFSVDHGAEPGLLGPQLNGDNIEVAQFILLLLHNYHGVPSEQSRALFFASIRPFKQTGSFEISIGVIRLDLRVLYPRSTIHLPLKNCFPLEYCFFTDTRRQMRLVEPVHLTKYHGQLFGVRLPFVPESQRSGCSGRNRRLKGEGSEEESHQFKAFLTDVPDSHYVQNENFEDGVRAMASLPSNVEIFRSERKAIDDFEIDTAFP